MINSILLNSINLMVLASDFLRALKVTGYIILGILIIAGLIALIMSWEAAMENGSNIANVGCIVMLVLLAISAIFFIVYLFV